MNVASQGKDNQQETFKTVENPALWVVLQRLEHTTSCMLNSLLICSVSVQASSQPASVWVILITGGLFLEYSSSSTQTENLTTIHCHKYVGGKKYSNVVIGCNVAMLSSFSFSTACRAHELTRKLSRDSEQLYS